MTYATEYGHDGYWADGDDVDAASPREALEIALGAAAAWVRDGDWDVGTGLRVTVRARVYWPVTPACAYCTVDAGGLDGDGDPACAEHAVAAGPVESDSREVETDSREVEMEADHARLIRDAMRDRDHCGIDPDDHDWTDGDPWSRGGTTLVRHDSCRRCGLWRRVVARGSQRNPDESDTVEYSAPRTDEE